MQHQFKGHDGLIEVLLEKQGDHWLFNGHSARVKDSRTLSLDLSDGTTGQATVVKVKDAWWVHFQGHTFCLERIEPGTSDGGDEGGLTAPMPGKVLEVLVQTGDVVVAGQALMILEAMKMEHRIVAATDGTISAVHFAAGDQVQQGSALLELVE